MKNAEGWLGLLAMLTGLTFSGFAIANHGGGGHGGGGHGGGSGTHGVGHGGHRGNTGVFIGLGLSGAYLGGPWAWGAYDTWPFYDGYYYAPESAALSPTYLEHDAPAVSPQQGEAFWYYCDSPSGYYPYVQNCPAGWQRVQPQLPPGRY